MARAKDMSGIHIAYTCGVAKADGSRYFPTMAELAKQAGVSLSHVQHIAGEQRWAEERDDFKRRVYENAVSQFESEFSRVLARADLDAAIAAADLIHHIRRRVERADEEVEVGQLKRPGKTGQNFEGELVA